MDTRAGQVSATTSRGHSRREVLGWVAAGGAGTLAACAGPGASPAAKPEEKEVTITYLTDWASGARGEYVKASIPRFMDEHPKIKVRVDNLAGNVLETILSNAAAGTLQDVAMNAEDIMHQLARNGDMKDITPVLKSASVKMDDLIHAPSTIGYRGKQYGMPFQFAPRLMTINKTLFREAGVPLPTDKTTFPQLLELTSKIARPNDNVYGLEISSGINDWVPYVWGWGGDRFSVDLKKTLLDQPGSLNGLQFYVDQAYRHGVANPLNEAGKKPAGVDFNLGNQATGWATSPGAGLNRTIGGKFEWDVMYHPIGPVTGKREIAVNDQANFVTAQAVKRGVFEQAAKLAIWFAASKTAQELMHEIGPGAMPVLKSVVKSAKFLAGPPGSQKIFVDQIGSFRDPVVFIGFRQWRDEVTKALNPAFAGQKSVQAAAIDAARAGDVVLAKIPN